MSANKTYEVGILIFDEVEILDFTGPYEVFSVARFEGQNQDTTEPTPFSVRLVSEKNDLVSCRGGLKTQPDEDIKSKTEYDIILVPGGLGARRQIKNDKLISWIKRKHESSYLTTSVCTGSLLLANAGLLKGLKATTHHKSFDRLENDFENITVVRDKKFVHEGKIITSGGISAGIDMSLYIVNKLFGTNVFQRTKNHMEYEIELTRT